MAKRKKKEPEGSMTVTVNAHTLTGEMRGGVWKLRCETMPDLDRDLAPNALKNAILEEFMRKAMAESIVID